jgi:hypothetical protein
MKRSLLFITALSVLATTAPAMGADRETHSVYKVTTYNLGALLSDSGSSQLSLQNYEPLMITSTKADMLSGNSSKSYSLKDGSEARDAKGFAIAAEYSATENIAVQGVLGVTRNMSNNMLDPDAAWEANLGLIYRFFDNLSYQVHFGYMDAGKLLKERSSYSDAESIIMISNKLTLSF